MAFQKERAARFANIKDRDWAPFFTGRREEIAQFDLALEETRTLSAQGMEDGVFRIYQGTPGCGKTSLLRELRRLHPELLFVNIREKHLVSEDALLKQIQDSALLARFKHDKAISAAEAVLELFRMKEMGKALRTTVSEHLSTKTEVVLYSDEAQKLGSAQRPGLTVLHENELGMPVTVILAGLSHTSERLRSIEGLSRLAVNSEVNMGAMLDNECVESTLNMLDDFGIEHGPQMARTCEDVARMSRGWPQHLNRAQTALSVQLLETDGDLTAVDMTKVEHRSDQDRASYYAARLEGSILGQRPELVSALVWRLHKDQPSDPLDFQDMCAEEINRFQLANRRGFDPEKYSQAMLERGVLSKDGNNRYVVAIPSMAKWLEKRYPHSRSTALTGKEIADR